MSVNIRTLELLGMEPITRSTFESVRDPANGAPTMSSTVHNRGCDIAGLLYVTMGITMAS